MRNWKPDPTPPTPNATPDEPQCSHFADGSSVCEVNGAIVLTEAKSRYSVLPCTPDSKPEKPTP